jgi:hypothetical protein
LLGKVFSHIKGFDELKPTVKQLIADYEAGTDLRFFNVKEKENENDKENDNENENEVTSTLRERYVPNPQNTRFPHNNVEKPVENYVEKGVENIDDNSDDEVKPFKGAVMLSENQISALLDEMGIQDFDYYVDRLNTFINEKNARISDHYAMILKWFREDKR